MNSPKVPKVAFRLLRWFCKDQLFEELAGVLSHAQGRIALIPLPGASARADLDTPEDWAAWRKENPHR